VLLSLSRENTRQARKQVSPWCVRRSDAVTALLHASNWSPSLKMFEPRDIITPSSVEPLRRR